jgi:hypothetical protein
MSNGRKVYIIIAILVTVFVLLPLFGLAFSVFSSLNAVFCHASR